MKNIQIPSTIQSLSANIFEHLRFGAYRFILFLILGAFSTHRLCAQAPALLWTTNIGANLFAVDSQTNVYANANGVVITLDSGGQPFATNIICPVPSLQSGFAKRDAAGDFYFAGTFDGTNDFGGTVLVGGWINDVNYDPPKWVAGYPTCYLAKYASNGSLLWALQFGDQAYANQLTDIALNPDDSVTVAFLENYQTIPHIAQFSSTGTSNWQSDIGTLFSPDPVKLSGVVGTNGGAVQYSSSLHRTLGRFYGTSGSLIPVTPPLYWSSPLSQNGKAITTVANEMYLAGSTNFGSPPVLQKSVLGTGAIWTQSIGTVEQWILGNDGGGYLYLAGTNGIFSKYDTNGVQIWTTNYPLPAISTVVDSSNNRFVQFTDNSFARIDSDPPPVGPSIIVPPQSVTVFVGDNVSLGETVSGTPPLYYQWQLDGTNLPNSTNAVLSLNSVTASQSGAYSVVVSNSVNAVTSSPPAIVRVKSVEIYAGSQLLTNGTYTFTTAPTLTIRSAFPSGEEFYTLDGSTPDFASIPYSGPFVLGQSATVRAVGYSDDFSEFEDADDVNIIVLVSHTLTATSSGGGWVTLVQASNPPPTDATSLWRGEGNTLDSAETNNGTAEGGLTYATGKVGQAFSFNGTDADVSVPASPTLDLGTSNGLTIATWFKADSVTTPATIVEWFDPGWRVSSYEGVTFTVNIPSTNGGTGSACLVANVEDTGGTAHFITTPANQFIAGQFCHAALSYDKGSGIAKIYVNGNLITQSNLGVFTPQTSSAYFNVVLGGVHFPVQGHIAEHFAGSLDEVTLFGRTLSDNEVKSIYLAQGGVITNPPSGSYLSTNTLTVQAIPAPGWQFLYWLGDAAGGGPTVQLSMTNDKSISAVFGTTLSTTVAGNGQVLLDPPGGLYAYGTTVRLTGVPQSGSFFGAWGNAASGNVNPLYFTVTNPTPTVSSIFGTTSAGQVALTVEISGHGHVNESPQGNFFSTGQMVTLTANPDPGQSFLGWSGDASGSQTLLNVTLNQSKIITANFSGAPMLRVNKQLGEGTSSDGFRFAVVSDPNSIYQVFCSSNLTSWESMGYVTNQFGTMQLLDCAATNSIQKYYRIAP